jgi:hypothetical protein
MKKVATILCVSALTTVAFAQGLVNFGNGPTTQISFGQINAGFVALPANYPGFFYFALLTSPTANGPFSFSGVYGTNSASAGRIAPYTTSVPGWAPGATMFYEVAGWQMWQGGSFDRTFDPTWLAGNFLGKQGFFGVSWVASGVAGGGLPVPAPAWNLFGGTGLPGFNLFYIGGGQPLPEPSSFALTCLGGAVLSILRRRKPMMPNPRAALDAGRTRCFHVERFWPGPSEHDR